MSKSMDEAEAHLRENILEARVEAAMQGYHEGPFEPVDEPGLLKFEAFCLKCGKSVYGSYKTLYSILEDRCPGRKVGKHCRRR